MCITEVGPPARFDWFDVLPLTEGIMFSTSTLQTQPFRQRTSKLERFTVHIPFRSHQNDRLPISAQRSLRFGMGQQDETERLTPWASQQCAQECPQTGGRPERHTSGPWSDMAGVLEYPSATICLDWRAVFSWMGVILRPCLTCVSPHVTASGHPEIMSLQQEVFRRLCHPHARSQRILIVAANT